MAFIDWMSNQKNRISFNFFLSNPLQPSTINFIIILQNIIHY